MDWVGRVIDGRYVVDGVVGAGGMGVVLSARHKFTSARVALKMMRKDLGLDPEISARFLAEARVPAAIDHRGVVKTLDAGQTPEGELYLVMELLAGRSLRAEMQAMQPGLAQIRKIGMELLDVLAAAHVRGVIHRDIKPENIFVTQPDGQVKLLDFGITKLLTSGHSVLPRTQAGAMLGTAAYMAPEQLADARTVDARADLWAVGITLYELIGGRRPFRGATVEELLVQLVRGEPDPIRAAYPQATPDLEAFFARGLAKDPQKRFASAGEMAQAFARLSLWPPLASPSGGLPAFAGMPGIATPPAGTPGLATPPAGTPGLATMATGAPGQQMYGRIKPPTAQTPAAPVVTPLPAPIPYPQVQPTTPVAQTPPLGLQTGSTGSTEQMRPAGAPWLLIVAGALAVVAGAGVVYFVMQSRKHETPVQPAPQQPPVAVIAPADASSVAPAPVVLDAPIVVATGSAGSKPKPGARGSAGGPAPLDPYAGGSTGPNAGGSTGANRPTGMNPTGTNPAGANPAGPNPAGTNPLVGAPPAAGDFCDASCKMLASCHLGSRTCAADCAGNQTIHDCLVSANGDCNAFAACMFGGYCGQLPSGGHSCSEAMDCESSCGGNQVCVCNCIQGLAPNRSAALLGLRGCAAPCRGDTACIAKTCDPQIRRCRAQ
ncbi:MAG: protein kinase [Deltaproteobacteria bacterium]|nr:protein kinase [Deltaproteobacteria bacterium]